MWLIAAAPRCCRRSPAAGFTSLPRSDGSAATRVTIASRIQTPAGDSIATIDAGADGVPMQLEHGAHATLLC